jgi:hypothetical protein
LFDGDAVRELKAGLAAPVVMAPKVGEAIVSPEGWRVDRGSLPNLPDPLEVLTLAGVRRYVEENVDSVDMSMALLHVAGPYQVTFASKLPADDLAPEVRRIRYLEANVPACAFRFGQQYDVETFIINLRTHFAPGPDRDALVALVGSLSESNVRKTSDDGISQEVVVTKGIAAAERAKVPTEVFLRPWRTFREVEQPESPFLVRLASGTSAPVVALHEVDAHAWKRVAVERVVEWLTKNVEGVAVVG